MSDSGEREWVMVPLDEKIARRQGIPRQVPVPKSDFEGLADEGLSQDKLVGWIKDFMENAPVAKDGNWRRRNSELVSQLEGYVDKLPLWDKAQALFAENNYEKALKTLKRITVMMPDDHAARMNYASALANQGDYDKAFKQLRQIRDTFEGEADFHVTVAQMHVARNNADAAVEELVTALEHQPDHLGAMDALAKLGLLAKVYENPRDAASLTYVRADSLLEYLQEHWASEERTVDYYLEQMGYHASERRWFVALPAAEAAIAAAGDDVCHRGEQGRIEALRGMGESARALETAKAYAERSPGVAAAQVELAKSLAAAGDEDGAAAAIDRALAIDAGDQEALALKFWPDDRESLQAVADAIAPLTAWAESHADNAGAWRSLARAKVVVGSDEQALELFQKAVSLADDDDDLRSEWWAELAAKQQFDAIVKDSEKIENLAARDWRLRWNEAEAYRGLGRMMEARAVFMQLNSDGELHVDIRKRAKRAAQELGAG
ncbi:MAG: tetratricopeptide repeat protein [Myxococcota bacterium]